MVFHKKSAPLPYNKIILDLHQMLKSDFYLQFFLSLHLCSIAAIKYITYKNLVECIIINN